MWQFRPETPADITPISQVITAAFSQPEEALLVEKIRQSENFIPELSIVAVENQVILGHILFSRIFLDTDQTTLSVLALAPLAVTPKKQRQGIGSQLVEIGLSKCRELNHTIVLVLGNPGFYHRFGFQTASKFNLQPSLPFPDEPFMVIELVDDALKSVNGIVRYPGYFGEV
ncbi:GNAT family N-acetyltransferase [Calothrix sp. 336/3]|uniref:GNAT family N-acetyltransferase n=1 Tax=Calothrix sp. 336/3 TaxID=1337936 RepID=UPI0004E43CF1|nr:N-acetyltransferase [Calothrix sp. 336/3]AKG21704.1 GCN5 family acetyltransferase [Calothrix sp. 336/3]